MHQLTIAKQDAQLLKIGFSSIEETSNKVLSILIAITNMIADEEEPDCHSSKYFLAATARDLLADAQDANEIKSLFDKIGV